MRVLAAPIHYVLDKNNSGSEFAWSWEIYSHLSKQLHRDIFFVTGGIRGVADKQVENLHIFDADVLRLTFWNICIFYFKLFQAIKRLVREKEIDIIHHVLPFNLGASFNLAAITSRARFIIGPLQSSLTVKDTDLSPADARGFSEASTKDKLQNLAIKILSPIIRFLSAQTLRSADRIIVINELTKNHLEKLGVSSDKIVIIPPGIDCQKFYFEPKKGQSTNINLLATGYLLNRKAFDLTIRAVAEVIKTHPNIHLKMVGDGPQREQLEELTRDLNIQSHVSFVGFVPNDQLGPIYKEADIYLCMSRSEGFSTVCLEAMASGMAIVSSRVGGFEDAINDGDNGYLVEQEDWRGMADRIKSLVEDRRLIKKFSSEARRTAVSNYDWGTVVIPKILSEYVSLLSSRNQN